MSTDRAAFDAWLDSGDDCDAPESFEFTEEGIGEMVEVGMWAAWRASRRQALTEAINLCRNLAKETPPLHYADFYCAQRIEELLAAAALAPAAGKGEPT